MKITNSIPDRSATLVCPFIS